MTYSSTNTKLDGRFRSITVKVGRPGVQTRFRRGYRALTAGELSRERGRHGSRRVTAGLAVGDRRARGAHRDGVQPARRAAAAHLGVDAARGDRPAQGAFWLVGTLDDAARRAPDWAGAAPPTSPCAGATAQVVLSKTVPLGVEGGFSVLVPESGALPPGDYTIRVRARGADGPAMEDTARASVAGEPPAIGEPSCGGAVRPPGWRTSGPPIRARRAPIGCDSSWRPTAAGEPAATLLDRTGQPMAVPLQVSARDEAGVRWIVVETALAPLAPGDYAVEVKRATRPARPRSASCP